LKLNIVKLAEIYKRGVHEAAIVAEICDEALDRSGVLLGEVRQAAQQLGAVDVATSRGFCANHQTIYDVQLGCPACPPRN
jgi:hypothetical protein